MEAAAAEAVSEAPAKRTRRKKADVVPVETADAVEEISAEPFTPRPAADMVPADPATGADGEAANSDDPADEPRRGWWQRTFGA